MENERCTNWEVPLNMFSSNKAPNLFRNDVLFSCVYIYYLKRKIYKWVLHNTHSLSDIYRYAPKLTENRFVQLLLQIIVSHLINTIAELSIIIFTLHTSILFSWSAQFPKYSLWLDLIFMRFLLLLLLLLQSIEWKAPRSYSISLKPLRFASSHRTSINRTA